jgi:uncharacterized protein (DUF305 family)
MKEHATSIAVAAIALIVGFSLGVLVMKCGAGGARMMKGEYGRNESNAPMGMHGMMQGMTGRLEGKTGDAFDQAFLDDMVIHHQGAVEMAKLAQDNAGHQEIKDLAGRIIEAQNKEIEDMRSWRTYWFGNE